MAAYMEAHPDVSLCGPRILRARAVAQEDGTRGAERLNTIDSMGTRITRARRLQDQSAGAEDAGLSIDASDVFVLSRRGA